MKRISAVALLALAGFIGTGSAMAQDQIRATVPFDFAVGNKVLHAGTYSITRVSSSVSAIEVQNRATWDGVMIGTTGADNRAAKNVLVFDKYNGHYFLHSILCDSAGMNMNLPATKAEQRDHDLEAKNPTDDGQVLLALNR
jgi:hypothetical protein